MKRKQSLEDIYSEHMHDLFRYLLSYRRFPLCGRSHARNLYRMLVHIDYYKGEEIRPWLFTIAYNAFIDWYRKEKDIKRRQLQNSIYRTYQVQSTLIL